MPINWQIDRGQINHNWLQNSVLVALNHAIGIVSRTLRTRNIRQTLVEDVSRWREHRKDVPVLLDRFASEMSPQVLFKRIPLCRCADETKQWLVPLTHELWLRRHKVNKKVSAAKKHYEEAEAAFQEVTAFLEVIPEDGGMETLKALEPHLRKFATACEFLSKAISVLPHEIIP